MNSLTVKPSSFVLQSSSTFFSSCKPKQCLCFPFVRFPRNNKSKRRLGLRIEAYDSSKSDDSSSKSNGDSNSPNASMVSIYLSISLSCAFLGWLFNASDF